MIGRTLGSYHIVEQAGSGGMATVYKAYDPGTDRHVAIKLLPEQLSQNIQFRERFEREAKAIARLEHLHILPVHAYGEENGITYLVMRYLQAGTLADRIKDEPLSLGEASRLLSQMAAALDYAHQRYILHCDVKPSNVLLDADSNSFLTDFGIAKMIGAADMTGDHILGTPQYMSPEQCQGRQELTAAADIYSLGIVLYEMLTGRLPFQATTPVGVIFQQLNDSPPPARNLRPNLPEAAEQVLFKALAKEPEARYPTAGMMAAAFAEAIAGQPADVPCPYKGLAPFEPEDAVYFFGRTKLVKELTERLAITPFLAVVGPSGSGKSSLARAGLLPALQQGALEGSADWLTLSLMPGPHPLEELAVQLSRISSLSPASLLKDLETDERSLSLTLKQVLADQPKHKRALLLVDQFEELFTLCRDEAERQVFVDNLMTAVGAAPAKDEGGRMKDDEISPASFQNGHILVVITLRADFYGHCAVYRQLAARLQDNVLVGPLIEAELREVIEQPAAAVGLSLEPGLVDTIVRRVAGEPGALPLLSHALLATWQRRRGALLTLSGYAESGGVRGAIAQTAETVFHNLTPEQQHIARSIFLRLTELGEGTQDTRRRATRAELETMTTDGRPPEDDGRQAAVSRQPSAIAKVLQTLADARLIITGADTVEVAHEALIREWPTLRKWLDENREGLRLQRRLTEAAQEWANLEHDPGALYRGSRLAAVREWAEVHPNELNPLEREFLEASRALQANELEIAQKQARQLRRRALYLSGALVAAVVMAVIALVLAGQARQSTLAAEAQQATAEAERDRADRQVELALDSVSRQLATQALTQISNRLDVALLLSVEANRTAHTFEARSSLLSALEANSYLAMFLHGHSDWVISVAFSPDSHTVASGSADKTIILWDVATGKHLGLPLTGHTADITSLAFSPDGHTLASGSADKTIILWDVATRQPLGPPLTGHNGRLTSLVFSPDGRSLASGSRDDTIILWAIPTGQPLGRPLATHTNSVNSVAFSPDGQTLASASEDKTVILWDVAQQQPLGPPLAGHTGSVNSVAFSLDGQTLASGSSDQTVILWDVAQQQPLGPPLAGHIGSVNSVAFSLLKDKPMLASASSDGMIFLWDITTRQTFGPQTRLTGHTRPVNGVAFSPDGQTLVSGSNDKILILWQINPGPPLGQLLTGHKNGVYKVAFSPDGQTLASASGDNTIILWDATATTHQPLGPPLTGHTSEVWGVAFSPDGRLLASGGAEGAIILWDVATRQPLGPPFTGPRTSVLSLVFSPDGRTLASSGAADGSIVLWDVSTRQPLDPPLVGHTKVVNDLAFGPDGQILASASRDKAVILWDVSAHQPLEPSLTSHMGEVHDVAFSPDGQTLASSSEDQTIILWDVATRQPLVLPLTGHGGVYDLAFSPDGQTLASGMGDGTIFLWDATAATHQPLDPPLIGHSNRVHRLAFSPDGQTLASGSQDKTIILWDVSLESWQARACRIANRNLTQEEWAQYFGEEPYRETCPGLGR